MTRVIQWATGVTGTMALRHVINRPDMELVGVRVYDPAKAGVDVDEPFAPHWTMRSVPAA
ncbi:hypothetical protein [Mycobacterium sp. GA-1841]|uniref:hypothetical protein n=1 Tax=Mycobacterium sp. GA-1841 TaxID=1834154 RepID=UPI0026C86FAA